MMHKLVIQLALSLNITGILMGCNQEASVDSKPALEPHEPTVYYMHHGQEVNIGTGITQIVGTDFCENGWGEIFSCWRFSLNEGDKSTVLLANGNYELWTTVLTESNTYALKRPNGVIVSAITQAEGCDVKVNNNELMATLNLKPQAQFCPLD